jgi:hypothetical protein
MPGWTGEIARTWFLAEEGRNIIREASLFASGNVESRTYACTAGRIPTYGTLYVRVQDKLGGVHDFSFKMDEK